MLMFCVYHLILVVKLMVVNIYIILTFICEITTL